MGQIEDLYYLISENEEAREIKKIEQMLLQAIYFRDKTQHLLATQTNSLTNYEWERTLKLCDGTGSMHEKLFLKVLGSFVFYGG